jgi:LuxR family maltose regulon positive regulatory protein
VPLDQSRGWYRYHRLFADLLRHRLRASPIVEAELHQSASQWYEQNGFPAEAIHHALAAKDWERAGSLVQSASTDFIKRGEVLTVIGWFQALPEEMLLSDPKLCFDYCWPLLLATRYDLAAPLLERLEQDAKDIPELLGEVFAAQAYLARGLGEHILMAEKSQRALALLPKSSVHSRGIVALNLGLAYWHMGQMQAAEQVLEEALVAGQKTGNQYAVLTAMIFQGRVFAVRGKLYEAAEYFARAIQLGNEIPINALAYMDLAALHYEWNALEESDNHLRKAILLCQRAQNDEFLVSSLMLQSRLRIALGDLAGAAGAIEQAWALVRAGKVPEPTVVRLDAAQARLLLAKGGSTQEWRQKLMEKVDCHPFYRFLGVTKALVLPNAQARAYLEGLSQAARSNNWIYGLVNVRALQAALAGKQEDSLGFLIEALLLAESGGFIRSFVEAGEKLEPLLREALRRGIAPDYAGRILAVMAKKVEITEAGLKSLPEALSEREIEVLRLVTSGLSNREIAGQLFISPGTAKTHIHHLCGKLGVRNRTEAAMKAKELGLV